MYENFHVYKPKYMGMIYCKLKHIGMICSTKVFREHLLQKCLLRKRVLRISHLSTTNRTTWDCTVVLQGRVLHVVVLHVEVVRVLALQILLALLWRPELASRVHFGILELPFCKML